MDPSEKNMELLQRGIFSFEAKKYVCRGMCDPHAHREHEIFGVIKGKVTVTISGERRELTTGQMVFISSLEEHSCRAEEPSEVFSFWAEDNYFMEVSDLYPDRRLPRWLMDAEYNEIHYIRIKPLFGVLPEWIMELKRRGIFCGLLSDMVEHYGTVDKMFYIEKDGDLVREVLQYVYDHYNEDITLDFLAEKFHISSKTLGKKLYLRTNMDFRMFVNDIRVQKAVQMRSDPANKDRRLSKILTSCGFHNKETFYRCYERRYGILNSTQEE